MPRKVKLSNDALLVLAALPKEPLAWSAPDLAEDLFAVDIACAGLETDAGTPPCDDGLTCEKMAPGTYGDGAICLKNCTADADSPLSDLISCHAGLCKLKASEPSYCCSACL